jgi:DNA-binding CsgD family transcriptional regulator
MRAVLIGKARDRARLREALALSQVEVVGEADTVGLARAAGLRVDAFITVSGAAPRLESDAPEADALTPREMDVLQLLAEGLPNKAIAKHLGISDQTVKFHLASICGKLGAQNRTDAVRLAIQRGIIAV